MALRAALISEHFEPRLGGITTYVKSFISAICSEIEAVYLLVPAEADKNDTRVDRIDNLTVVRIGVGASLIGDISARTRIYFLAQVNKWLDKNISELKLNAIHVIFGMYAMRYLDQSRLPLNVTRTCMVHNVPPAECDASWPCDTLYFRIVDHIRKLMVRVINRRRIAYNVWDTVFVASDYVRDQLTKDHSGLVIKVVPHGVDSMITFNDRTLRGTDLRILTVSRITPHKNQHIIPGIIDLLSKAGIRVSWTMVGPRQHDRYATYIEKLRCEMLDPDKLIIRSVVSNEDLINLYKSSDIYVHTSLEEGFGLTILEAAMHGLPVVGMDTGAIPEIVQNWYGCIVNGSAESFAKAIVRMTNSIPTIEELEAKSRRLIKTFSWKKHARSVALAISAIISERGA